MMPLPFLSVNRHTDIKLLLNHQKRRPLVIARVTMNADNEAVEKTNGEMKMKKDSGTVQKFIAFLELCYHAILFMFG